MKFAQISSILDYAVENWPNKTAVICGQNKLTYTQFAKRTRKLANFFLTSDLSPGSRIVILHHNCHKYLETYFAAAYAGLVLVPINFRLSVRELGYILQDSGANILICHIDNKSRIIEAISESGGTKLKNIIWTGLDNDGLPEIQECVSESYEDVISNTTDQIKAYTSSVDDPAHLYYTSGTTGKPKGVVLTHKNVLTHAQGAITEFLLTKNDVWGHIAPMYHLADAWATFAITQVGGTHLIAPKFDPPNVLNLIREEGMTITNLIPTMLNLLVHTPDASDFDYPSLRYMLSGGAPIAPELVRKVINTFGCEYVQTYGMTETSPYLTVSLLKEHLKKLPPEERFKYQAKTGRKFITVDLKVVREDGSEIKPDDTEVGEIWVRGPSITPGYWNKPDETQDAFEDDWLKTGDLATIDSEGYVNIVDRKKDLIVSGGENVYSTEVEHILYEHPLVLEAAVIGVPDDTWGEAIKAVVVLKPGKRVDESELIDFCKTRLAHYKAPKSVDFISELPKTGSGKIYKKALKDKYWTGYQKRVH